MPQRCPESILSPARRLSPNVAIEQLEFNGATFFCRRFSDLDLLAAQIIPRMNVNRAGRSAIKTTKNPSNSSFSYSCVPFRTQGPQV